jgi:2-polyprenyl-3-methyl-5-hydroxy-6-metoxy-1,4-benzoquinol methylase
MMIRTGETGSDDENALHAQLVASGQRFQFGKNWSRFLEVLDDNRIEQAVLSLQTMLETDSLAGKSFLDIGSGSGLFSLAARRLGAKVHSFDFDPQSVACTAELKRRYFDGDSDWTVQTGSVLDKTYLESLGQFDIVYSWGVLHHTGDMWSALDNVDRNVAPGGRLFISLYNDKGRTSRLWRSIKKTYVSLPSHLRWMVLVPCYAYSWGLNSLRDLVLLRPFRSWREYSKGRGMSAHRDMIDWVGGYPYEVSSPSQILSFYRSRGYELQALKTCSGLGCNEFVFSRRESAPSVSSVRMAS